MRRKENDLTLDAIAGRLLRTHGVRADKSMLSRFFAAERIRFKKTVRASEQDRPAVAERRQAWRRAQKDLGGRLMFLETTWTSRAMTRRYASADIGARARGQAVYADKGYAKRARSAALRARGIKPRIMFKSWRGGPAPARWRKRANALIAARRAQIEGVFATLKRWLNYERVAGASSSSSTSSMRTKKG